MTTWEHAEEDLYSLDEAPEKACEQLDYNIGEDGRLAQGQCKIGANQRRHEQPWSKFLLVAQ